MQHWYYYWDLGFLMVGATLFYHPPWWWTSWPWRSLTLKRLMSLVLIDWDGMTSSWQPILFIGLREVFSSESLLKQQVLECKMYCILDALLLSSSHFAAQRLTLTFSWKAGWSSAQLLQHTGSPFLLVVCSLETRALLHRMYTMHLTPCNPHECAPTSGIGSIDTGACVHKDFGCRGLLAYFIGLGGRGLTVFFIVWRWSIGPFLLTLGWGAAGLHRFVFRLLRCNSAPQFFVVLRSSFRIIFFLYFFTNFRNPFFIDPPSFLNSFFKRTATGTFHPGQRSNDECLVYWLSNIGIPILLWFLLFLGILLTSSTVLLGLIANWHPS